MTSAPAADLVPTTRTAFLVDGEWRAPATNATILVESPATGEVVGSVPSASLADVDAAVEAADRAFRRWSGSPVEDRIAALHRLADALAERVPAIAAAMTLEVGTPVAQAEVMHAAPCVAVARYYAELLAGFAFEERRNGARSTIVRRRPVGPAAALIPWNGPPFAAIAKLAPALAAGCSVVLKPSPDAPLSTFLIADAVQAADLPPGLVNVISAEAEASAHLVAHPLVRKVAFTGSEAVGRSIAEVCGRELKHCTLELGGKSAAVLLDDVDLDAVLGPLRMAAFANNGELCTARSRVLVPRSRAAELTEAVRELTASLRVGDPADPTTEVGPMISRRHRDRVLGHVERGSRNGATLLTGGGVPEWAEHGWYVTPTAFGDVDNSAALAQEEIFGPVVTVTAYDDEDDAVRLVDDSRYGLSGTVFTTDVDRGIAFARRVDTGQFGINQTGGDLGSPFGGVKASGMGREMGPEGLAAYLEHQTLIVP